MKKKILSLCALSILSLVIIAGMVSATTIAQWNFDDSDLIVDTGTGTLVINDGATANYVNGNPATGKALSTANWDAGEYFGLTINLTGYQDINISLDEEKSTTGPTQFKIQYSSDGTTFTDLIGSTTSTVTAFTATAMHTYDLSAITALDNNANAKLRITVPTAASDPAGAFHLDNLKIEGSTYTAPVQNQPDEIQECSITGTAAGSLNDDLKIKIEDIKVISGFGDDNEWLPLDEVEVEINVENKNKNYKIRDIEIKWGFYDSGNDDWYIDDKESKFKLSDGDENTVFVTFKLDDNIDDLENYDIFYVWADGYLDNTNSNVETDLCSWTSEDIDVQSESDFIILDNIQLPDTVKCGSTIQLTADIWNIGDNDQEDVWILIKNQELGISEKITIGDVDALDKTNLDVLLKIPKDAEESPSYLLTLQVYNEDDDVFENDYGEDKAEFKVPLKIEGSCTGAEDVSLIATLQSGGTAGEELVIKATVTNLGDESRTYVLKTSGFEGWASTSDTQIPVVVGAGNSKDVLITLNVNDDASGSKLFSIEVLSGAETVLTQPVSVTIEGKVAAGGFNFLTGGAIASNKYLWAIGALNVILVIVIIIVAIKVDTR